MLFNMKQTHLLPALALAATLVHALPATKTGNIEARQGPQPALPYPFGFNADTCPPNGNLFIYGTFQTVDNSGSGSKRSFDASDPGLVPLEDEAKRSLSPLPERDGCLHSDCTPQLLRPASNANTQTITLIAGYTYEFAFTSISIISKIHIWSAVNNDWEDLATQSPNAWTTSAMIGPLPYAIAIHVQIIFQQVIASGQCAVNRLSGPGWS